MLYDLAIGKGEVFAAGMNEWVYARLLTISNKELLQYQCWLHIRVSNSVVAEWLCINPDTQISKLASFRNLTLMATIKASPPSYTLIRKLGTGTTSKVYLASPSAQPTHLVAIKTIKKQRLHSRLNQSRLLHEIALLKQLCNDHVVQLIDFQVSFSSAIYYSTQ